MTEEQKDAIQKWIVENVDDREVPEDEGLAIGLIYNLVHLLRDGRPYRRYHYEPDQDAELAALGVKQD